MELNKINKYKKKKKIPWALWQEAQNAHVPKDGPSGSANQLKEQQPKIIKPYIIIVNFNESSHHSVMVNACDCDMVVSGSNVYPAIKFTYRLIPLVNAWT